ncbi:MAG: hypothetical protein IPF78_04295 [Flavobacteriales bacterium]|nr:hypothetical protein [Flavobacteriales bacterium]
MHGPWNDALEDGNTGWLHDVNTNSLSSASALDTLTQQHLEHIESGLNVIEVQQENAIDIRPRLAQLNLTMGEFNQLMAVRDILSASQSLTDEEKLSVKRILAQVKKRRKAFVYRKEEMITGTAYPYGITLSQDFFQIPSDPIGQFPPAPEHPLVPWLTSDGDLIRFRSTLRGRIEQEKSALDALKTMLDEVDEAMMVKLRDALVTVCGDPTRSLVVNARTLGDKLLIDLENNCCFKTNRVAAAIETLQQFLWKTRTGDILHDYPTMEYIGGDFDEAWMWMGSYSNWRAAMFVFLYPENVLLPSLRKNQTPAFQAVVEATRNNRRFGPKDACKVARDYRDYLVDLVDLDLKCSAEAEVFLRTTGCGTQTTDKPQTLFVFAQGRATHNSYFTTVDARDKANINQNSYWQAIPGLDDTVRIFGCTVYFIPDGGGEFIYLFFTRTGPDNADKFFALRFNLLNGLWEENPLEFKVDTDDLIIDWQNPESQYSGFVKDDFSPIIKAIAVRYCTDTKTQPTVAISLEKIAGASKDVYTFYWPMRQNGTEFKPRWGGDGWRLYIEGNKILKGLVRFFVGIWVDENAKMLDHSLLVLRSGTTTYLDLTAWGLRHDWLLTAKAWFLAVGWPEWGWEWNGEIEYIGAEQIDGMITAWEALLPQVTNHVGQSSTDYLAYIQTFGGTTGGDTIYIPPQYNADLEREIRTVLPFYDWSTVHLEVVQNGDRRRDVVTYTTDDPEVPIITNDEPLNSSDLSQWLSFIAPVRDARYFDPTNAAFEAGWWVVAPSGRFDLGRDRGHVGREEYHIEEPLESRILVSTNVTVLTPRSFLVPTIQSDISLVAQIMRPMLSSYDLTLNSGPNFRLEEYVWEAYYFVPMQIALQLCTNGYYQDALDWFSTIYDISRPVGERKIYYGLVLDEQGTVTAARAADWYSDPLNPHAIAALRPYTYTRYTMLAIAQCLLAYADAEYTTDNSETVPRAREMYEDAQALLEMLAPRTHALSRQRRGHWVTWYPGRSRSPSPRKFAPWSHSLHKLDSAAWFRTSRMCSAASHRWRNDWHPSVHLSQQHKARWRSAPWIPS